MKTETQFSIFKDMCSVYYRLTCLDTKVTELFDLVELNFLGVPEKVIIASEEGPVTFKLTFERL